MKKGWVLAAALLWLLTLCPGGLGEEAENPFAQADDYFQGMFFRAHAIGGGVMVSQNNERVYSYFSGAGDKRGTRPVDEETVYKVASVTKMVAAMGVMKLVEEGKIGLDDPLPGPGKKPVLNPRFPETPVTLRQVLSHTSSLLHSAPYAGSPPWDKLTKKDKKFFSRYEPGVHYEYANLNGGMLCSIAERISGQSFNTFMKENLFAPLGINAAFAAHLLPEPELLSNTYDANGISYLTAQRYRNDDAKDYEDTCDPDAHYRASVGSLYISLSGLEKVGQALACGGMAGDVRVLEEDTVRLMMADQSTLPGSSVSASGPYGLGVCRFTAADGITWYGHQGKWEGLLADVFAEPETHTVIVLVMNGVQSVPNGKEVSTRTEKVMVQVMDWLNGTHNADKLQ